MKWLKRLVRLCVMLIGIGTLAAGGMALAGSLGWPMELFQAWPWMIAIMCMAVGGIGFLTGQSRLAAANGLAALLLIVNALLSIGGLPEHPSPQGKANADDGHLRLVWANVMRERDYGERLTQAANAFGAQILAAGEAPRGKAAFSKLDGQAADIAKQGAILVAGCTQDSLALRSVAQEKGRANGRSRVFAHQVTCPDFTLFAVHARNPLWAQGARLRQRNGELAVLAQKIAETSGPVVIVGDFNTSPNMQALKRFSNVSKTRRIACGGRWRPTWRPYSWRNKVHPGSPLTGIPIDHLFVRDIAVTSCVVGPDFGSDHLPLMIEVKP